MKNQQLRLRLPSDIVTHLRGVPIPVRNQLVAVMLRAQIHKIDLPALIALRTELASLGSLINQSLRSSWGRETHREAVTAVVVELQKLFAL
jgi:hypothetical protein